MKTTTLFFSLLLLLSLSLNAQNPKEKTTKAVSIYTFSSLSKNVNSISKLNKKLNLKNFRFVYANQNAIDLNLFALNFDDIGVKPSTLIYDDYLAYRDENLLKGFRLKNDPTRWNLQFPNSLSVQPTH